MDKPKCSIGWSDRCATATSDHCTCKCGGENHGKGRIRGLRADMVILDEAGPMSKVDLTGTVKGDAETREVYISGQRLDPKHSQAFRNHSPDGFSWGYGGSGPSQLALAILLHLTTPQKAQNLYQQFKFDIIATLTQDEDFELTIAFISDWIAQH